MLWLLWIETLPVDDWTTEFPINASYAGLWLGQAMYWSQILTYLFSNINADADAEHFEVMITTLYFWINLVDLYFV